MGIVRECLTGGFQCAVPHKSLFLISFCCQKPVEQHTTPRTEVIGDRLEMPSVNILLTTKLLNLNPLSWDMDCLLTLWPLLIPCSLSNGCYTFGFLIFIIIERNFLYNSLYILTERSLKHLFSIRAWVPVSFFLSLSLFHFLIVDSGPSGSSPLKDLNRDLLKLKGFCTAKETMDDDDHKVRRQSISQEKGSRLSSFVIKRMFTKGDSSLSHTMTSVPESSVLFCLKRNKGLVRNST